MNPIDNILRVLDQASSRTITVFGDFCLDKYLYINPARDENSLETGLTAYQVDKKTLYPGAAGTVTNNLRALGVNVHCVGLVGEDGEGYDLLTCLANIGAHTEQMVVSNTIPTSTYIKPMRRNTDGTYTEMNRLDIRNFQETPHELENQLINNLHKTLDESQGVVIIDQFLQRNCSAITDRVRDTLSDLTHQYPDHFFLADSRGFTAHYHNVIIKCNQHEIPGTLERLAENNRAIVVTVGENGAFVYENSLMIRIPPFPVTGPLDIVGAGDATNAGTILGLTLGLPLPESVLLGGCISSITIQQIGVTGTATMEQVKERLGARIQ